MNSVVAGITFLSFAKKNKNSKKTKTKSQFNSDPFKPFNVEQNESKIEINVIVSFYLH